MLKNIACIILIILLFTSCEDINDYMPSTDETNKISIIAEVDNSSIDYTSALINGYISNVYTNIVSFGLYCDTVLLSTNTGHKVEFDHSRDYSNFSYSFTNLENNKTYYAVAYVNIDSETTVYSQEKSFTTLGCTDVVIETIEPNNIEKEMAFSGGIIQCDGGSAVTQRGVVWSTKNDPEINTFYCKYSINGDGKGEYPSLMNNLQPGTTYYVRAYAINSTDTYYGESYSFETKE